MDDDASSPEWNDENDADEAGECGSSNGAEYDSGDAATVANGYAASSCCSRLAASIAGAPFAGRDAVPNEAVVELRKAGSVDDSGATGIGAGRSKRCGRCSIAGAVGCCGGEGKEEDEAGVEAEEEEDDGGDGRKKG